MKRIIIVILVQMGVFGSLKAQWQPTSLNIGDNSVIRQIAMNGTSIFVAASGYMNFPENGVYRSTNNGKTWQSVNNGLANTAVVGIVASNGVLICGTDGIGSGGLYRSTNNGDNWVRIEGSTINKSTKILKAFGNHVFAELIGISADSLYYSSDSGVSWVGKYKFYVPGTTYSPFTCYAMSNDILYGMVYYTDNGGNVISNKLYRSLDNGSTWEEVYNFFNRISRFNASDMIVNGAFILLSGIEPPIGGGVIVSYNGGQSWLSTFGYVDAFQFYSLVQVGEVYFTTGAQYGVYYSTNRGYNWVSWDSSPPHSFSYLAQGNGYVYGTAGTVWRRPLTELAVKEEIPTKPTSFVLEQNYPNPFNPSTVVRYQLAVSSQTTLKVYDVLGREVATLVNERKAAGTYQATFNGSGLASGIYLYRLQSNGFTQTKKMLLVK